MTTEPVITSPESDATNEGSPVEHLSDEALDKALSDAKQDSDPNEGETTDTIPDGKKSPVKTPEKTPAPVETADEKLAKLEKRLADKEAFLAKQDAEIAEKSQKIGELRKLVPEPKKELHQVTSDNFFEDPVASVEKISENAKIRLENEQKARSDALMEVITRNKADVSKFAPDYESNIETISEILKEDGFNEEGIKAFKANPYTYNVVIAHNLNRAAKLTTEIRALRAENAQLKGNPKKILDKVESITRQKPKITSQSGSHEVSEGVDIDAISDSQLKNMTDEQIDNILKKHK